MKNRIEFLIIGALIGFLAIFALMVPLLGIEYLYIPWCIPGAIVGAIIGLLIGKKKDDACYASTTETQIQHNKQQQDKDSTTILLDYKKLLNAGVITQEEFDKKKEELLKKL
jgi:uncharacterized protein YacL